MQVTHHGDGAPLIEFRRIGKSFSQGNVEAVRDIDLVVGKGEFVILLGPSGCGKSTLLNMAAGIFPPTTGEVLYAGKPVAGLNQRVGYMTQSDHLLPWRSVAGNIAIPLEIAGLGRNVIAETVAALIARLGLGGFEKAYPSQLSGGMKKRVALARLLAYDPETLLMDEPFGALDAQLRLRLQSELRSLCKSLGKTAVFVTHDIDEAVALGDRCVVFSQRPGSIREIVTVQLRQDRRIDRLRFDPDYVAESHRLFDLLAPAIEAQDALDGAR
jgi:NitT/TauT family transport system ATP-binding protein